VGALTICVRIDSAETTSELFSGRVEGFPVTFSSGSSLPAGPAILSLKCSAYQAMSDSTGVRFIQSSDSPVTFRFRYHHTDPSGVEESPQMTIAQNHGGRIAWDMSGLSDAKLASADRLELVWYPEDHPPGSGFTYNGQVCVDNVRVTDDHNEVTHARWTRKHRELERTHGLRTDQIIQSQSSTTQQGVYEYRDGTQISYQLDMLQNGNVQETCDGETFVWEVSS